MGHGGSSSIMKRLLLAGILCFVPVPGLHVDAHDSIDLDAPTAAEKPVAAVPSAGAPAGHHAGYDTANAVASRPSVHAAHEAGVVADNESSGHHAEGMTMLHPGLPGSWILPTAIAMFAIALWSLCARLPTDASERSVNVAALPLVGPFVGFLNRSPYPLLGGKLVAVALYLLLIVAGLFGTPYPERNLATALVWNLWWPLVVVSVLFLGTAWCAVCPWDAVS